MKKQHFFLSSIFLIGLIASCTTSRTFVDQKKSDQGIAKFYIETDLKESPYEKRLLAAVDNSLFGTLHLYPKTEIELSQKVISKLQKCNVLVLERKITNKLGHQKLADFQIPSFVIEGYEAIVADYGDELVSMEGELIMEAINSNLTLTGLESTDESLAIMKSVREIEIDENKLVKEQMLRDYKESLNRYKNESIADYYSGMVTHMGEELTNILVDERNKNWIKEIEYLIQTDPTFIAVGVGHLGGENGILNLLAQKGYRIKRIE